MTSQAANNTFKSLGLSAGICGVLDELGFQTPTPIQTQSIPHLLEGKDLIGQAKTGSGKTAAFALPILEKLRSERELQALIMCPTRELSEQVTRDIRKLGRKIAGLRVLQLAGGQPIRPQIESLEEGAHIAVGTPGRISDHIGRRSIDLSRVSTIVLDEADRMLDLGFEEVMAEILAAVPRARQTVLFSATFPASIDDLSRKYQKNPARITVAVDRTKEVGIDEFYLEAALDKKYPALLDLLQKENPKSCIVFCNFKATTKEIAADLNKAGFTSACLNGDLEQYQRDQVMIKFRNETTRVLVATDVAARGLDIKDLDLVVNFELPVKPDIYVHRIGRTGRAGKSGLAISLVAPREKQKISDIEELTGKKIIKKTAQANKSAPASPRAASPAKSAPMETIRISGGRKDKLRPGDILGALTGESGGLRGDQIGKIEIQDRFAFVGVTKQVVAKALKSLQDGKIKGRKFHVVWMR